MSSCIGSSFELEGDLRCFGKPITVFFHVVSVAGRDYGFLRCLSDLDPGLVQPFVVARGSLRVCFYHLSTHLKGLACVSCVSALSENHHIGP